MARPVAVVVGVGPGLGSAVARRFAREGFAVAALARSEVGEEDGWLPIACDATDAGAVSAAFARVRAELGVPEVLVYNAGAFVRGEVHELEPAAFEGAWRANCLGAFLAAREIVPDLRRLGRGTILLTGATASTRGSAGFSALAVGKWGLRALAQSLARENAPHGVHVAHVIVDGMIDLPRTRAMFPARAAETFLAPDAIAETYWALHRQERTAWTLELDVRPATERF